MNRRLVLLVVFVGLASMLLIAPVSAGTHLRGDIQGDFNAGIVTGEGAAPDVSWVGTLEVGSDQTYFIVWYPETLPNFVDGYSWVLEDWKVFADLEVEFTDGVITVFEPGPVVIEGHEFVWGTPFGIFYAHGWVDEVNPEADPYGLIQETHEGRRTYWTGQLGDTPTEFFATFWIRGR